MPTARSGSDLTGPDLTGPDQKGRDLDGPHPTDPDLGDLTGADRTDPDLAGPDLTTSDLIASDGRRLGRRAQETRRRLLDATAELIATKGLLDLTVVEIARRVGTSPASFYQYFQNVEEAALALSEVIGGELEALVPLVEQPWRGRAGFDACRELVRRFIDHWDEHRAVLRVRDLAAQEGDRRFRDVRNASLSLITDRLTTKIAEGQAAGKVAEEMTPYAAASAMVAMMGRMAAYHGELETRGFTRDDMVETVARIVYQTVTGRRP